MRNQDAWLPTRSTQRTKLTARLSIPYFIRSEGRRQLIERGLKPAIFADKRPNQRGWRAFVSNRQRQNPIRVAREYEKFLQTNGGTYADAAEAFGVTKVTVCHYISVVRRLPKDFVRWLEEQDQPLVLGCFRECRLRPITRLESDQAKREELASLVRELRCHAGDDGPDLAEAMDILTGRYDATTVIPWMGKEPRAIQLDDYLDDEVVAAPPGAVDSDRAVAE